MSRTLTQLGAVALLLVSGGLSGGAYGIGVSGELDALETEMLARRDQLAVAVDDPVAKKSVKKLEQSVKLLNKPKASLSLAKELSFASKAAKIIEKKLAHEASLQPLLVDAIANYKSDLRAARNGLATAVGKGPKLSKLLKRADKALADAEGAATLTKQLAKLSKVAKFTAGYEVTGEMHTWVLRSLTLSPANGGVDVDGDGDLDNGFAAAQSTFADLLPGSELDIDQLVADALMTGDDVTLLQMWGVDSFDGDERVFAGLLTGMDTDQDRADNFSGVEAFDVTGRLGDDGYAPIQGATAFTAGGNYRGAFGGSDFDLIGFTFDETMRVIVDGTADAADNVGSLGFALPLAQIYTLLEERGVNVNFLVRLAVGAVADVDLDGNGSNDALSISFDFDAVGCDIFEQ